MVKNYLFSAILGISAMMMLASWDSGAPQNGGYTGSPGDGANCTSCHNGSASTVTGWITSDVPATGYVGGAAYTITMTVSGSGTKGFEISPQSQTGTLLGTLTPTSGTHLVNNNKAVTQSSASSANPKVWTVNWTAPPAGTGPVTFYGAFCVSKPNTKLCTLVIPENTTTSVQDNTIVSFSLWPNPVHGQMTLTFSQPAAGQVEVTLFSPDGRKAGVLFQSEKAPGSQSMTLDLSSDYKPGLYIMQVKQGEKVSSRKIILT